MSTHSYSDQTHSQTMFTEGVFVYGGPNIQAMLGVDPGGDSPFYMGGHFLNSIATSVSAFRYAYTEVTKLTSRKAGTLKNYIHGPFRIRRLG